MFNYFIPIIHCCILTSTPEQQQTAWQHMADPQMAAMASIKARIAMQASMAITTRYCNIIDQTYFVEQQYDCADILNLIYEVWSNIPRGNIKKYRTSLDRFWTNRAGAVMTIWGVTISIVLAIDGNWLLCSTYIVMASSWGTVGGGAVVVAMTATAIVSVIVVLWTRIVPWRCDGSSNYSDRQQTDGHHCRDYTHHHETDDL